MDAAQKHAGIPALLIDYRGGGGVQCFFLKNVKNFVSPVFPCYCKKDCECAITGHSKAIGRNSNDVAA
jgi:hypothetical protein